MGRMGIRPYTGGSFPDQLLEWIRDAQDALGHGAEQTHRAAAAFAAFEVAPHFLREHDDRALIFLAERHQLPRDLPFLAAGHGRELEGVHDDDRRLDGHLRIVHDGPVDRARQFAHKMIRDPGAHRDTIDGQVRLRFVRIAFARFEHRFELPAAIDVVRLARAALVLALFWAGVFIGINITLVEFGKEGVVAVSQIGNGRGPTGLEHGGAHRILHERRAGERVDVKNGAVLLAIGDCDSGIGGAPHVRMHIARKHDGHPARGDVDGAKIFVTVGDRLAIHRIGWLRPRDAEKLFDREWTEMMVFHNKNRDEWDYWDYMRLGAWRVPLSAPVNKHLGLIGSRSLRNF